jgi:phage shock protein PspC (stress-responsive transcriptional regulator)
LWRTDDRWLGGVSAGLAHRLGWDPLIVRGLFIVAAFFSGVGPLVYGAAWLLLPEASDGRIHAQEALSGRWTAGTVGGILMFIAGTVSAPIWLVHTGPVGLGWALLVLVAALVVVAVSTRGNQATPWQAPAAGPAPYAAYTAPGTPAGGPAPYAAAAMPPPYVPTGSPAATSGTVPFQGPPPFTGTEPEAVGTPAVPDGVPSGSGAGAASSSVPFQAPPAYQTPAPTTTYAVPPPYVPATQAKAPKPPKPARPVMPPPPPQPRRRRGGVVTYCLVGLVFLALAAIMVLERSTDVLDGLFVTAFAVGVVLGLHGLGLIVLGLCGRRVGGFVAATIPLVILAGPVTATSQAAHMAGGALRIGEYSYSPDNVADLPSTYGVSMGDLGLDLTGLDLTADSTPVNVETQLGIGLAEIYLPDNVPIRIQAHVEAGSIYLGGQSWSRSSNWSFDWETTWSHNQLFGTAVSPSASNTANDDVLRWRGYTALSTNRATDWAGQFQFDEGDGLSIWLVAESPEVADGAEPVITLTVDCAMGRIEIWQPTSGNNIEPVEPVEPLDPDGQVLPDEASAEPSAGASRPASQSTQSNNGNTGSDPRLPDLPAIPSEPQD